MKIYVAGKWGERSACKAVMVALEESGHSITCDWTNHDYPDDSFTDSAKQAFLAHWAEVDIQGVRDADVLVFLAMNENNYRGAFVEMGAALGLGKPVYVVGHGIDSCVFMDHPLVKKVDALWNLLAILGESR